MVREVDAIRFGGIDLAVVRGDQEQGVHTGNRDQEVRQGKLDLSKVVPCRRAFHSALMSDGIELRPIEVQVLGSRVRADGAHRLPEHLGEGLES